MKKKKKKKRKKEYYLMDYKFVGKEQKEVSGFHILSHSDLWEG